MLGIPKKKREAVLTAPRKLPCDHPGSGQTPASNGRAKGKAEKGIEPGTDAAARPGASSPALRLKDLTKRFHSAVAVDGLDLILAPGEIVALVGPSGCGKTTTLRLVAGLDAPDEGLVEISGHDCRNLPPERRRVGFVFQDYALFPHMTVGENVAFGLHGLPADERDARVAEALHLVGLTSSGARMPNQLSGGQQQRVALARAIAPRPALLLLDEPLSNLDPQLRRQVRHDVVSIIRSSGAAAIWVTHDHDEGLIISDRVVVMEAGKARQIGTPSAIWHSPADAWVARFIGTGDFLEGTVRAGRVETKAGSVIADGLREGEKAQVLVRPQDLILDPGGCPGTVVRRHFSGSDNVYCVQMEDGTLLHCRQPGDVEISRGTRIRVRLASVHLKVYAQLS